MSPLQRIGSVAGHPFVAVKGRDTAMENFFDRMEPWRTNEGALHLEDVLARRTRMSIETRHRGVDAAQEVADIIAPLLGWSDEQKNAEVTSYAERVAAERKSQELETDEASDEARLSAPDPRPDLRKVLATR